MECNDCLYFYPIVHPVMYVFILNKAYPAYYSVFKRFAGQDEQYIKCMDNI